MKCKANTCILRDSVWPGSVERELLHAAVPLWGLLLAPQAEGAGVQVTLFGSF
jgi:hypothetical protein